MYIENYYFHFINGFLSFQSVSHLEDKNCFQKNLVYYENIINLIIFTVTVTI